MCRGGGELVSFDSIVTARVSASCGFLGEVNPGDYKLWLVEDSKTQDLKSSL